MENWEYEFLGTANKKSITVNRNGDYGLPKGANTCVSVFFIEKSYIFLTAYSFTITHLLFVYLSSNATGS